MKSDNNNLYSITADEIKNNDDRVYNILKNKELNKVYYQNVYTNEESPLGFLAISYKDKNYILSDGDKTEILRIIEKIKNYL